MGQTTAEPVNALAGVRSSFRYTFKDTYLVHYLIQFEVISSKNWCHKECAHSLAPLNSVPEDSILKITLYLGA